MDQKET